MRLERPSAGRADAVDLDAHATTVDYQADQLALTSLDVDPAGDTAGRSTLAEAPELALALDPAVAPAVTGIVDVIRDER